MLMILAEIYVLVCILFLAGKDASSYLLKDHNRPQNSLDTKRIQRWHRDGVALNALVIMPIVYLRPELYWIIPYTLLIRLAVFDIAFNKWASLDYKYLGSTAWADKFFSKIFGQYGAVKKSIFFAIVLIALNIFVKH
jgi:hypothetical protein